ncbi:hypothetical protein JW979_00685 [bacterium]|nr:hypothetical protein [candidate division CSSED10-310 bacterium]
MAEKSPLKMNDTGGSASELLDTLQWMAGAWKGTGLGGTVEEIWAQPEGGAMMGMFRLIQCGCIVFYEFMTLSVVSDDLVLKVKHFDQSMKGWETPDQALAFKLLRHDGDTWHFEGLTIRRTGDDTLQLVLSIKQADGSFKAELFDYRRNRL